MGKNLETHKEYLFDKNRKTLKKVLNIIEEEYKIGNNFLKNGNKFSNAEKFFMDKIKKLSQNYRTTKDKEYIKISSDMLNRYNKIIEKYS